MSTKIAALAIALALAGGVFGFLSSQDAASLRAELDGMKKQQHGAEGDAGKLRDELSAMRNARDRLALQIESLLAQLADQRATQSEGHSGNATPEEVTAVSDESRFGIATVEEADPIAQELSSKGDLEGLWLLAAELLAMGEPGFEKLVELAVLLDAKEGPMRESLQQLWRHEELLAGRFFQTLTQHTEGVLKLGLYLDQRAEPLPELLRDFHRELDDEMGVMLLGMYKGNDASILDSYTDRLEGKILNDPRRSNDAIRALGEIRSERSTDVLLSLLNQVDGRIMDTVVQSLAWQRSPRALTALTRLRVTITDPARGRVIDAAIRYLK